MIGGPKAALFSHTRPLHIIIVKLDSFGAIVLFLFQFQLIHFCPGALISFWFLVFHKRSLI